MAPSAAHAGGSNQRTEVAAPFGAIRLVLSCWPLFRAFPGSARTWGPPLPDGRLPNNVIGIGGGSPASTGLVRLAGWAAALTGLVIGLGSGSTRLPPGSRSILRASAVWCFVAAWMLFFWAPPVAGWRFSGAFFVAFLGLGFGAHGSGSAEARALAEPERRDEIPPEPVPPAPEPPPGKSTPRESTPVSRPAPEAVRTYSCPRCGGAVAGDARISPRGASAAPSATAGSVFRARTWTDPERARELSPRKIA